jgi:thiamine biosynthesis protein ThiI
MQNLLLGNRGKVVNSNGLKPLEIKIHLMDHVIARYGEIGVKSKGVRKRMIALLKKRIKQSLEYHGMEHEFLEKVQGRIVIKIEHAEEASAIVAEIPGVVSASPAIRTTPVLESIKKASDNIDIKEDFGVRVNRVGNCGETSGNIERIVGERVQKRSNAKVNLKNPETWIEIDVREEHAFIFSKKDLGCGGFPIGSEGALATLISGGIDSPVAAYEVMTRGCDITPIYFYNRPIASEDHIARVEEVLKILARFHPLKRWYYYRIDMQEANTKLMTIERGRMVLHRMIMFRIAEEIALKENLNGIVTGEAIGQKSSQTPENMAVTSAEIRLPVLRPLLTKRKEEIVESAKKIGTFESSMIKSACATMAPRKPATSMKKEEIDILKEKINFEELICSTGKTIERVSFRI